MICRGIMVKPQLMNDPHANEAADDIIALLELCQQLQSAKDGIERPVPGGYIPAMRMSLPIVSGLRTGMSCSCVGCYR